MNGYSVMPELDPIQAQLIAARRAQILNAATAVFAEKGVHRATIKDVARAAGIADGTIYNYFSNKEALLLGILDRLNESQQRADHFAQAADTDPTAFIRGYLGQRLAHLSDTGIDVIRVLFSELLVNPALRQTYYQQVVEPTFAIADGPLAAWVAEGAAHTSDPRLANRAMAGMVLGLILLRALGDTYLVEHWNDAPAVLADLLLYGLAPTGDNHAPHQPTGSGEPPV
jgi:TetR/AcrR family fatty acid metabolism transcriptional regulator